MEDSGRRRRLQSRPSHLRPYRSHAVPACARCRQRKARCTVDLANLPCLLCRLNGAECDRAAPSLQGADAPALQQTSPAKSQTRRHRNRAVERLSSSQRSSPQTALDERERSNVSAHILGPGVTRDAQVLQRSLPTGEQLQQRPTQYRVYSSDPSRPVFYMHVPRRREGLYQNSQITFKNAEILEKLVEPNVPDLVNLYFEKHHPCFPVVDEEEFRSNYCKNDSDISATLRGEVYASALIYWEHSAVLKRRPRPDLRYGWNLATAALNEEFLAPDISLLPPALLYLTGRPTFSITGNALNLGRAIALAHTLGLNRDPSKWQLTEKVKNSRSTLWWALVIHDRWFDAQLSHNLYLLLTTGHRASLSHGTPPQINGANCDVLVPTIQTLLPAGSATDERVKGAHFFVQLCKLSEIIATLLSAIYDLHPIANKDRMRELNRLDSDLEDWAEQLPPWLSVSNESSELCEPGAKTLQLSYFTARMSLSRLVLQESSQSEEKNDVDRQRYLQSRCRRAGRKIVDLVTCLTDNDLNKFWLPYNAYGLSSAVTLLLRCAVEAGDPAIASDCFNDAKTLVEHLRRLKDENGWDMGDICLAQCEAFIRNMCGADDAAFAATAATIQPPGTGGRTETDDCLADGIPWGQDLNDLFPELWDMFQVDGAV